MVTDQQVRKLMSLILRENSLARVAAKAGMDEKTARRYRRLGKLPIELMLVRSNRTRKDPFAGVWGEVREKLENHPSLEAKTLFDDLKRRSPGRFRGGVPPINVVCVALFEFTSLTLSHIPLYHEHYWTSDTACQQAEIGMCLGDVTKGKMVS